MALSVGNRYLASEFIALKARVKAEMQRRKYKGSLVTYASSSYDYSATPTAGNRVFPEYVNKIVEPLNAINDTGVDIVTSGDVIKALDKANAFLTTAESYSLTGKTTDCKASCTGLCITTCGTSCSGCSGSCTGGCGGSCSGCSGCSDTCKTTCAKDNCDSGCWAQCSSNCWGTSCKNYCDGGCKDTCKGGCSGCSNTCTGKCASSCTGSCTGSCVGGASSSPV